MRIGKTAGLVVLSGMAFHCASASAQELNEIIVTAQKKSENLQTVPIAITALSADTAQAAGVRVTEDLNVVTPGLNLGRSSGGAVILLRGVGALTAQAGQDASVPVFIDGVYQLSGASALFALNNVERVEVLKGPQGTLYGRNATGGAINIITRTPSSDTAAEAEWGYGNYDTVEARFYGTTGIAQGVAADLALYYNNQGEGWGRNVTTGEEVAKRRDFSVRSKVKFEASDTTQITLSGDYWKTSGSIGPNFRPVETTSAIITGQQGFPYGFYDVQSNDTPFGSNEQFGVSLRLEQELGDMKLVSISAYQQGNRKERADLDSIELDILTYSFTAKLKAFTQEFQLSGNAGDNLDWIVGAFFLDSKEGYEPFVLEGAGVAPLETVTQGYNYQRTRSYAAFGQATLKVTPSTRLTLGARYTVDERRVRAISTGELPGELPGQGSIPIFDVSQKATFKKPTWRIGIDHDLSPDAMVYATYSRGFKSGIFNLSAPDNDPVKPEVLDAFEIGLKSKIAGRLRFNPSVFYYAYKDIQAAKIQGGQQFLLNAAKAEIYGLDADFEFAASDRLTLRGGMSYLHARYKEFQDAPVFVPNLTFPYGNLTVDCAADPAGCDLSGNRIPRSPDWTANLGADYRIPVGAGEIMLSGTYAYNDGWKWEADNRTSQKPFHIVNAQIMWSAPDEAFNVRVWGRNLLKEKYYSQVQSALADLGVVAAPRTYGVSMGFKF